MNATEQKAYEWLKDHGASETSIIFQSHASPDFLTDIGKFEVKTTQANAVVLTDRQLPLLDVKAATTFLVYTKDSAQPLVLTPQELQKQFKILMYPDKNVGLTTIPIAIQRSMNFHKGDKLIWSIEDDCIRVRKKEVENQ